MTTTQAVLAALGFSFAGFALAALAMDRHHEQVTGRDAMTPRFRACARASGMLLAVVALGCCLQPWSVAVAVTVWLGVLSCAALATAMMLSFVPRGLPYVAAGAGLLGGLLWVVFAVPEAWLYT